MALPATNGGAMGGGSGAHSHGPGLGRGSHGGHPGHHHSMDPGGKGGSGAVFGDITVYVQVCMCVCAGWGLCVCVCVCVCAWYRGRSFSLLSWNVCARSSGLWLDGWMVGLVGGWMLWLLLDQATDYRPANAIDQPTRPKTHTHTHTHTHTQHRR